MSAGLLEAQQHLSLGMRLHTAGHTEATTLLKQFWNLAGAWGLDLGFEIGWEVYVRVSNTTEKLYEKKNMVRGQKVAFLGK